MYRPADGEQYDQSLVDGLDSPVYLDDSELPPSDYFYVVPASNEDSESEYSNEVSVTITSVQEYLVQGTTIELFSNPTSDALNLNFSITGPAPVRIAIKDMTGREPDSKSTNETEIRLTFNAKGYPAGAYFLTITIGAQVSVRKFVKSF